ncbi:hypothetical protein [Streptomyces qinzhouensis]|uniref:Uncharacterized protein n=1 Tax=Streptomyces qinzhouensis TaxID=2599401 RepID=A0A5B8J330_9ACTN|nr:hypothetical protein [Streptomyces qinzhouensis]QDY75627.1 hypothetical protein FQU76_02865 [Streptomyces qinzhouensis]
MPLTRKLSTIGAAVALTGTALLTAPAAQATGTAPSAAPAAVASGWVPMGTHPSPAACAATGQYLVSIWLIPEFYCDPYWPYMLYGWK